MEAMEDVDGSSVVVLQRGSHHHVVVGVLIEVPNGGDGGAESGILVVAGILQRPVINKPVLQHQGGTRLSLSPPHFPPGVPLSGFLKRGDRGGSCCPPPGSAAGGCWPLWGSPVSPMDSQVKAGVRRPSPAPVPVSGCRRTLGLALGLH